MTDGYGVWHRWGSFFPIVLLRMMFLAVFGLPGTQNRVDENGNKGLSDRSLF